mmetsp:Transcript_57090/g.122575  ORF Transcript_57090/g.122575 Transcript_57090/m.122575 type:complete len:874 (+) Transcript_57090:115-2736(+)
MKLFAYHGLAAVGSSTTGEGFCLLQLRGSLRSGVESSMFNAVHSPVDRIVDAYTDAHSSDDADDSAENKLAAAEERASEEYHARVAAATAAHNHVNHTKEVAEDLRHRVHLLEAAAQHAREKHDEAEKHRHHLEAQRQELSKQLEVHKDQLQRAEHIEGEAKSAVDTNRHKIWESEQVISEAEKRKTTILEELVVTRGAVEAIKDDVTKAEAALHDARQRLKEAEDDEKQAKEAIGVAEHERQKAQQVANFSTLKVAVASSEEEAAAAEEPVAPSKEAATEEKKAQQHAEHAAKHAEEAKAEAESQAAQADRKEAEEEEEEAEEDEEPAAEEPATSSGAAASSEPAPAAAVSADDPLGLEPLFEGGAHGKAWEPILRPVIEALRDAGKFIGPGRNKGIVPVREMTFQALKPNPPAAWKVVSFGQSPYPRMESATGIAHFDNTFKAWEEGRFGTVQSMRCIIKASMMDKLKVGKTIGMPEMRKLLKDHKVVPPAEWFQAMLAQGVLLMNAALTIQPPGTAAERSGKEVDLHVDFWRPVIQAIVESILAARVSEGVVFAWWGVQSLKTKKFLEPVFEKYSKMGCKIAHVENPNPAAYHDAFCDPPQVMTTINGVLTKLGLGAVDWLPYEGWQRTLKLPSVDTEAMGAFMKETMDLHKMYLERLEDGLSHVKPELPQIHGVASAPVVPLPSAMDILKLEAVAKACQDKVKAMKKEPLTVDEAAAVHLYTRNELYRKLNEALRSEDREKVKDFFRYLKLFMLGLEKLPTMTDLLYRGVALDLSALYPKGSEVTWWAVSSCTSKRSVAEAFSSSAKKRTMFIITPRKAVGIKHLSAYQGEEEYILAPGTTFKVQDVVAKSDSLTEVHLEELDKPSQVQ